MSKSQSSQVSGRTYQLSGKVNVTPTGLTWNENSLPQDQLKDLRDDYDSGRFFMIRDESDHIFQCINPNPGVTQRT